MKSYFILDCPNLGRIQDSLYGFYTGITAKDPPNKFWTHLTRKQITDYLSTPNLEITKWFDSMKLKVRDISFTVYNEKYRCDIHRDEPPVVAKINVPVLNTANTYNVWYDDYAREIDRVECQSPIVLRSDILHAVEIGPGAVLPRLQFSFCFYNEPLHLLS